MRKSLGRALVSTPSSVSAGGASKNTFGWVLEVIGSYRTFLFGNRKTCKRQEEDDFSKTLGQNRVAADNRNNCRTHARSFTGATKSLAHGICRNIDVPETHVSGAPRSTRV
jgi:hypothetical protein